MRFFWTVILSAICVVPALAQSGPVSLHVEAGVGDTIRTGSLTPVRVRLANQGVETFDGRVGVAFEGVLGQAPSTWVWSDVQMAAGSEKRIDLVLPPGETPQRIQTQYVDTRGRLIAKGEGRIKTIPNHKPCILAVGNAPRSLPPVSTAEELHYTLLTLAPELMPRDHLGLAMFDAIVIAPPPFEPMEKAQMDAIAGWVFRGGILIVEASKRTEFLRTEGLAPLLPFFPSSALQGDLGVFSEPVNYCEGSISRGEVLWASGDVPLLVAAPRGLGTVGCYTVDTDSPGFLKSDAAAASWREVLAPLHLDADSEEIGPYVDLSGQMRDALVRTMESGPRSSVRLGAVVLLTLLYALAVGPGDYLLIRWLRRPRLTWVTFPAIVFAFTAFSYFGAKIYIGGELETGSRVRIVAFVDEGVAVQNTVNTVFAPAADTYEIATASKEALYPLTQSIMGGEPRLDLYPDDGKASHNIPIWTQRFYLSDTDIPLPAVGFSVSERNGRVLVEVRNNSTFALSDHSFAWGRFFLHQASVGTIQPGETREIDVGSIEEIAQDNLQTIGMKGDYDQLNRIAESFADRMALYRVDLPHALGMMRGYNLRSALDQGAAVWICRTLNPESPAPLTVGGSEGAPPRSIDLQLVTYKGVSL